MLINLSKIILFIFALFAITACQPSIFMKQQNIIINNQVFKVEIAQTQTEIAHGLSNRRNLCQTCGMLFKFQDYQIRHFWMKEMNFPLDIIWIKNDIIVGLAENVPILTEGEVTRVSSNEPVNLVLEVNSGWAKANGVTIGDKIGLD